MGFLGVLISAVAAWLLWDDGPWFFGSAIFVGVQQLWSWGVMHNYATNQAKWRPNYRGGFYDFEPADVDAVPDWLAFLNLLGFLAAVALLITGIIR